MTPATEHNDDSVVQTARTALFGPGFLIARWLFVRCLAALYLVTFLSLCGRFPGCWAKTDILPRRISVWRGSRWARAVSGLPHPVLARQQRRVSVSALRGGVVGSCLVFLGVAPSLLVISLAGTSVVLHGGRGPDGVSVGRALARIGFLALFLTPRGLPRTGAESAAVGTGIVVIRLVLFRLVFIAGAVRLHYVLLHGVTAFECPL